MKENYITAYHWHIDNLRGNQLNKSNMEICGWDKDRSFVFNRKYKKYYMSDGAKSLLEARPDIKAEIIKELTTMGLGESKRIYFEYKNYNS